MIGTVHQKVKVRQIRRKLKNFEGVLVIINLIGVNILANFL